MAIGDREQKRTTWDEGMANFWGLGEWWSNVRLTEARKGLHLSPSGVVYWPRAVPHAAPGHLSDGECGVSLRGSSVFHFFSSMRVNDFLGPFFSTRGISGTENIQKHRNPPRLNSLFPQQRRSRRPHHHRPAVALGRGKPYLPRTLPCCPVTCPGRTVVEMWVPAQLANWGSGGSPPVRWDKP